MNLKNRFKLARENSVSITSLYSMDRKTQNTYYGDIDRFIMSAAPLVGADMSDNSVYYLWSLFMDAFESMASVHESFSMGEVVKLVLEEIAFLKWEAAIYAFSEGEDFAANLRLRRMDQDEFKMRFLSLIQDILAWKPDNTQQS